MYSVDKGGCCADTIPSGIGCIPLRKEKRMSKLGEWLKSLPQIQREKLAHAANSTGAYVTSIIYKGFETTSLPMAVEIDKMSGGQIDFRTLLLRNSDVDWDYVRKVLNERPLPVAEEAQAQAA